MPAEKETQKIGFVRATQPDNAAALPKNPILAKAHEVIQTIRQIARSYMRDLDSFPEDAKKEDAREAMQKLDAEARKGEQANESWIRRLFEFLAEISTNVWDVAVKTLASPIAGISLAFQKVAQRAKEERTQGKP